MWQSGSCALVIGKIGIVGSETSMIGVVANREEHEVVREFFELFKTPWEFYRNGGQYDVLIYTNQDVEWQDTADTTARLVVIYADHKIPWDDNELAQFTGQLAKVILCYKDSRVPIYGSSSTFNSNNVGILKDEESRRTVGYVDRTRNIPLARIGYDLFKEVVLLLSGGQPPENAAIQTLDLHIALLRDLISGCMIPFVEIPPIPDGYNFIACLTHDMDHPAIRYHKWDHTMFGFLYRAVIGSLVDVCRRRVPVRHLFINWGAAVSLPLVYLGLVKDFWHQFHRYLEIESGLHSTFFVIPFKNCSGHAATGLAPRARASSYAARDIADHLRTLAKAGCEIGLHGINAWSDSSKGREELEEITSSSGVQTVGVRMHWLYFDAQSPIALERAGCSYDSTMGYNETVGYRAGTAQVFKPLQAARLLELPLHVMDTALFFPSFLNLSPREAKKWVSEIIENAHRFGGVVTINWHDRSIAPERLWDQFYVDLVSELRSRRPWFATAHQVVAWFQKRRSVRFQRVGQNLGVIRAEVLGDTDNKLPGLLLRQHNSMHSRSPQCYVDIPLTASTDLPILA